MQPGVGSESESINPVIGTIANGSNEFLTFSLGDEAYGIDILKVQEIRGYDSVTSIANAPAFIKGVINLRGNIVPIIDLRIKFNLGSAEYNSLSVDSQISSNRQLGIQRWLRA